MAWRPASALRRASRCLRAEGAQAWRLGQGQGLRPARRLFAGGPAAGAELSSLADANVEMPSMLSEKRLKEFLNAEVTHFASMPRGSLTLQDLLLAAASPRNAAHQVHQEIPKHFAARIRQIEEVADWKDDEDLVELHTRYYMSFKEMRMTEVDEELVQFTDVVRRLKRRQRKALPLIGSALKKSHEGMTQEWLHKFLRSRISTEMLTAQYLAIIQQQQQGKEVITGIVDPECDPTIICQNAVKAAKMMCLQLLGSEPQVNIEVRTKRCHSFSYIPVYLHYVLLEVLKNSCRATTLSAMCSHSLMDPLAGKPVSVVICSDDHRVAIRISDRAGGIPFDVGDKVWDFGFTGTTLDNQANPDIANNLAGYGLGLPLARLYARYLGGNLTLVSLPDYGVDTYLFLPRIDSGVLGEPAPEPESDA